MASCQIEFEVVDPSAENYGDVTQKLCDSAGLTCVVAPMLGWRDLDRCISMWREWLDSDEASGEYMVTNAINGYYSPKRCLFYFTDDLTAFAFKMRFG